MSVATAATWVWLGMVVAISFIEAPVKFRAPGVTVPIGLGIGRLVFRALNGAELVLAAVVVVCLVVDQPSVAARVALIVAIVVLLVQLSGVRPRLSRRTAAVLAGEDAPRSHAHLAYVGLEVLKLVALVVGGVLVLAG